MNVYTYYDRINGFTCQIDVIKLWEKTWRDRGFEPRVLNESDARKHPYCEEYVNYIQALHEEIVGKPIDQYGTSCYLRWLAYANTGDDVMYTSDYDVLNFSLEPVDSIDPDMIHLMQGATPCLVTGSSAGFEKLARVFVRVMIENIDHLKQAVKDQLWLHDQEILAEFIYNGPLEERTKFVNTNNLLINYDFTKYCHDWRDNNTSKNTPCVHYSHHSFHSRLPILRGDESSLSIKKFEKFCESYDIRIESGNIIPSCDLPTDLLFELSPDWTAHYQKNLHRLRLIVMQTDILKCST